MIISNVVQKEQLREVQLETLKFLKETLKQSFGPVGSTTTIYKKNMLTKYTKDGYNILNDIQLRGVIEKSVKKDLVDITQHIVSTVGDGTTSAVILSALIFEELTKLETEMTPYEIIEEFKSSVRILKDEIEKNKRVTTTDDIYNITLIATNGNVDIANNMKRIYEEFGMGVFIDVGISNTSENILKSYDGMTLNSGYADTAYINNKNGNCEIRNPKIYAFQDPIDTPEMMTFLNAIILNNIYKPASEEEKNLPFTPTVIMAPSISRDLVSYMDKLITYLYEYDNRDIKTQKPPILIITNIYDSDSYYDITRMCGCKPIKKYIDPKMQELDIVKGIAPTPETIDDFAGTCDLISSDMVKSKFVNPKLMFDEEGKYSTSFNSLVEYLESELKVAYEENEDNNVTGNLKRRINSLKANMVEYLIGGISVSDRDSLRDLVEDAVKNCRSAAKDGFGYAANFEGLRESYNKSNESSIFHLIYNAYYELSELLYGTSITDPKECKDLVYESLKKGSPYNIKTKEFDGNVLSSIQTDITILDAISKIITLMYTSNQFLCEDYPDNTYHSNK